MADTPVVLIHGARQSGKTTPAQQLGASGGDAYFSFDDDVALAAARADPVGFVADLPERAILDEVQRAPELFTALKSAVDRRRAPGRFLLTGSANVLLRGDADPARRARPGAHRCARRLSAAARLGSGTDRARLINVSELASSFQLSRPTIRDYVTLLERLFLLDMLPPWHVNRLSRLIKTPKLHVGDTGVACALLGLDTAALIQDRPTLGQLLEAFVDQELRRQASWHVRTIGFHHYRDKDGAEVDIVLECGAREVVGIIVSVPTT